jgi:hypothetical protein
VKLFVSKDGLEKLVRKELAIALKTVFVKMENVSASKDSQDKDVI